MGKKETCQVCGKKTEAKLTIVISPVLRLNTCGDCLNDYANHRYERLTEKVEKHAKMLKDKAYYTKNKSRICQRKREQYKKNKTRISAQHKEERLRKRKLKRQGKPSLQ